MLALHLCLDSVLKALHTNKGILKDNECGKCASEGLSLYQLTAIVVATKPPDVVQQTLDIVQEQPAIAYSSHLNELAKLLEGEAVILQL